MKNNNNITAKPFLKWAGGKRQLIQQIKNYLPNTIYDRPFTYIEPFAGGGAILFWMLEQFPNIEKAVINDINTDLTNCYIKIKEDVRNLITILFDWQKEYHEIYDNQELKKEYYYEKRNLFNTRKSDKTTQSALLIFLNKTCFNGLYRVNSKNGFNVPIGSSKSLPKICDVDNLQAVSEKLKRVEILNCDYTKSLEYATENTFFYFDPPYKPLNQTSSFNSYSKDVFDDNEQIRLKEFCNQLNNLGHQWMLSNSDVKVNNPDDNFFDELYADFNINRVEAKRMINSKGNARGKLTELLITNQVLIEEDIQ